MNIAFYFFKPITPHFIPDNIFGDPSKWPVYKSLFETLEQQGQSVYFVSATGYQGNALFTGAYKYQGGQLVLQESPIRIDLIFDKSKGSHTPPEEYNDKTYNTVAFKKMASDKSETEKLLGIYMAPSTLAATEDELRSFLTAADPATKIVIKPIKGIKGRGIAINTPNHILLQLPKTQYPYLVQKFIDTSHGIPGITESHHDLRVIAINGSITMAVLRTPPEGSLLANVALGGSIKEVPLSTIPPETLTVIQEVFNKVENKFPGSFYSMDFGIEDGRPYLFELNDRIGFPRESMPSAPRLVQELAQKLTSLSEEISL